MPHLDEGTLHALLDGELELAEVKEIQTHLGACSACGSRLQDVKQFLAEADRLVGSLEAPAGGARLRREPAPPPQSDPPPRPAREPVWDSAPELLLPGDPDELARRRRWKRALRWAAMIVVVLGAGRLVRSALAPGAPDLYLSQADTSAAPPAVVSPEETVRPPSPVAKETRPTVAARPRPLKAAAEPKLMADQPAPVPDTVLDEVDTAAVASADSIPSDTLTAGPQDLAAVGRADTAAEPAPATERRIPAARQTPETDLATRQAAAEALEELDRERIRSRANAATAALPPARSEAPSAVAAPPPPRTLEQKAQIYLRIGLDEASKQLGRPMHVIEAMTPEFIGLAQGRLVTGADPARPVVRVVYRDTRGRMILLDQQRIRAGQAPAAAGGNLRWAIGDVMLYLHGEPSGDVLRGLQRRVR
jgi:hypothetical protein